ncbi:hypothetical protein SAMN05444358_1187 [Ruegeria halocynthiae]|uniref:Uncharacterized protein n=1 Tax=Ruegeria halocynthiae TaxID=985054 RepID=A0A1H3FTB5_9RHOB|nr:hypothetical protein [Ruegeria halocynthiae]SDX94075.1 hypothetical protein SAMN05444358_1187 [Ruegeria halocynthiae]
MVDVMVNRMSGFVSRLLLNKLVIVGLILTLLSAREVSAELQGCPDGIARNNKLLIGSMELGQEISERNRRALLAAFEMRFERADASLGSLAKVIYCPQRQMQGSNTYDANVTGVLNDELVLLEVGARISVSDVVVAYVVVPLRHYEFHNAQPPRLPGYHEAVYEKAQIEAGLAGLFRGNAELRLLAALALGLRHEKAAEAAVPSDERKSLLLRSRAFYCDAVGTLIAAQPRPDFLGLEQTEWESLGEFARAGAERVLQRTVDDYGDQSTLPILLEIRGEDSAGDGACVEALPSQPGGAEDQ